VGGAGLAYRACACVLFDSLHFSATDIAGCQVAWSHVPCGCLKKSAEPLWPIRDESTVSLQGGAVRASACVYMCMALQLSAAIPVSWLGLQGIRKLHTSTHMSAPHVFVGCGGMVARTCLGQGAWDRGDMMRAGRPCAGVHVPCVSALSVSHVQAQRLRVLGGSVGISAPAGVPSPTQKHNP
jgi:hypothetical protein